jgi:hypothetical protein
VAANVIVNLVPTLRHRLLRKALSVPFHLHVVLASVTWQVRVRSRSCSPMAFGSRKSFAA